MDIEDFRKRGKELVDYVCQYMENIGKVDVTSSVQRGILKDSLPDEAPVKGENFEKIIDDFKTKIMPGIVYSHHYSLLGDFSYVSSYPSILADMLSNALGSIGFSWVSCPALTELEIIMLDWYAKALGLPKDFITETPGSRGGGVLQSSSSDAIFVCMLSARSRAINLLKGDKTSGHDSIFLPQLIAYASKEAHSSVEKAAKMALVKLRIIDADERGRMRVDLLKQTIQNDIKAGLTPFFVVATVGTTGACAFDNLTEIGKVCEEVSSIWFHVDGAYAGNSFILPEMRIFSEGIEYADSFNTNPNKLLPINNDVAAMWVRDVLNLKTTFNVDPLYLQHSHEKATDLRHYGIPLSRRFRSFHLWFAFRAYGLEKLRTHVRNHIKLAKKFELLIRKNELFEICNIVNLGVVCFRLKSGDAATKVLLELLNYRGERLQSITIEGKFGIRFCIANEHTTEKQIEQSWTFIQQEASSISNNSNNESPVNQYKTSPLPIQVSH